MWKPPAFDGAGNLRTSAPVQHWIDAAKLALQHHNLSDENFAMAPSGSDVVIGASRYFFKTTAPCWSTENYAERDILQFVEGKLSIATPRLVAHGHLEGWPYVITERVDGLSIAEVYPRLTHQQRLVLAGELGEKVAELHALPPYKPDHGWDAFLALRLSGIAQRHAKPGVPEHLIAQIDAFIAQTPRPAAPLRSLHTEVLDEHVLVRPYGDRWEICAMLDFADGRVGHPDYELVAPAEFIFRAEPGLTQTFLRAYGWSAPARKTAPRRLMAWALIHQFGSLKRALHAGGEPRAASLDELGTRLYG